MQVSFKALMTQVVDYAGLFPPARLPLDQAVRNYARYAEGADRWMLGRFVIPASRLAELAPYMDELFGADRVCRLSVIGTGGAGAAEFLDAWRADLDAVRSFHDRCSGAALVEIGEVKIPDDIFARADAGAVRDLTARTADLIESSGLSALWPFYEPATGRRDRAPLSAMIQGVADHNKRARMTREGGAASLGREAPSHPAGVKLRCGGTTADAFPSPEHVAFVITACRDAGAPLKCTAGLHHPLWHFDDVMQVQMHGFLNVFLAGILANRKGLTEDQIRELLEDHDETNFRFSKDGCFWKSFRVSSADIASARDSAVTSFGSCSFDEPREALRGMGWI